MMLRQYQYHVMRKENKQPFFYFILENDCRLKIEQCFVHGDLCIIFFPFNYTKNFDAFG